MINIIFQFLFSRRIFNLIIFLKKTAVINDTKSVALNKS